MGARKEKDVFQRKLDRLMRTANRSSTPPSGSSMTVATPSSSPAEDEALIWRVWGKAKAAFAVAAKVADYLGPVGRFMKWAGVTYKDAFMRAAFETEEPTVKRDAEGNPVYSRLGRIFKAVAGEAAVQRLGWDRLYKFNEPEFKRDIDGSLIFNKWDASKFIALTLACAMTVPVVAPVLAEGAVMATTTRTETAYLYYPNSRNDGTYSVRGCLEQADCGPEDSVYYNVRPSIARHIYSYATEGTRFLPRKLVGPISFDSNNRCEVTIYDAPWRWLWEQFDSYPELLDIDCTRLDEEGQRVGAAEIQQDGMQVEHAIEQIMPQIKAPIP